MEAFVLDKNFQAVGIVDNFISFIWTERYADVGEFELVLPMSTDFLGYIKTDGYLLFHQSDRTMIIETIEITTDVEDGHAVMVKGRSLESILDRRVVWDWFSGNENLQTSISRMLDQNFINPTIVERKIPGFSFIQSTDPAITPLTVDNQLFGDEILEVITKICETESLGFRILMPVMGTFQFGLYMGTDRSYRQLLNPYVVFSPEFDNLLNSSFVTSKKLLKTVSLVGGEGEGAAQKKVSVDAPGGALSGLDRRETYTDGGSVSSNTEEIPVAEYEAQLKQKGRETLAEAIEVSVFEGEAEPNLTYIYGVDYFLGDVVQIENEYGFSSESRITEYIWTEDASGTKNYPTFTAI